MEEADQGVSHAQTLAKAVADRTLFERVLWAMPKAVQSILGLEQSGSIDTATLAVVEGRPQRDAINGGWCIGARNFDRLDQKYD